MRGRVVAQLALVAGGREHLAVAHDHRADRHVVVLERALGLAQREPHVVLVAGEEVARSAAAQSTVLPARDAARPPSAAAAGRSRSATRTPRGHQVERAAAATAGSRSSSISSRYQSTVRFERLGRASAARSRARAAPSPTSSASPAPSGGCPRAIPNGTRSALAARRRAPATSGGSTISGWWTPGRVRATRSITSDQRRFSPPRM